MFKAIRIVVLLIILLAVGMSTWRAKTNSVEWKYTLPVNVYPINADGSAVSADYIRTLTLENFQPIETFMQQEAVRYGHASNASIEIRLGKAIDALPPELPQSRGALDVILWSLNMRWWAYRHGETHGAAPQVKLFLLYFDPATHPMLQHSTALQKGLIGRVNVFASRDMAKQNAVIITHEFLHTLGATDKYDLATGLPIYPEGYANAELNPLLPQQFAEIMGGRIPVSKTEAEIPVSLDKVLVGERTAGEINWVKQDKQ
ncbi:MAG TPA: hypothetical protein VIF82_07440 [Burkholderiaceae bacterium]|jgi:hypothetical protein